MFKQKANVKRHNAALITLLFLLGLAVALVGFFGGTSAKAEDISGEIIFESADSNTETITVTKFNTPALSYTPNTVGSVINLEIPTTFGYPNVVVNFGNYETKEVTTTKVYRALLAGSVPILMSSVTGIQSNVKYDVWAHINAAGSFVQSDDSNVLSAVFTGLRSLTLSGSTISWNESEFANRYYLNINTPSDKVTKTVTETTFDLLSLGLVAGAYDVLVYTANTEFSAYGISNRVLLNVYTLATPVIRIENMFVKWDAVERATGYRFFYDDTFLDTTATEIDIFELGLELGEHAFKVRAIGNLTNNTEAASANLSTYIIQSHRITYNVNGSLTYENLDHGSHFPKDAPKVEGYTFAGWYYDLDYTQKVNDTDTVSSDSTLYARFVGSGVVSKDDSPTWYENLWINYKWYIIGGGCGIVLVLLLTGIIIAVKKK